MSKLEPIRVGVSPEVYARIVVARASVFEGVTIYDACKQNAAIEFYPDQASGAAPELLEALVNLRKCIMETRGPDATEALFAADAAIAKAKGEQQ